MPFYSLIIFNYTIMSKQSTKMQLYQEIPFFDQVTHEDTHTKNAQPQKIGAFIEPLLKINTLDIHIRKGILVCAIITFILAFIYLQDNHHPNKIFQFSDSNHGSFEELKNQNKFNQQLWKKILKISQKIEEHEKTDRQYDEYIIKISQIWKQKNKQIQDFEKKIAKFQAGQQVIKSYDKVDEISQSLLKHGQQQKTNFEKIALANKIVKQSNIKNEELRKKIIDLQIEQEVNKKLINQIQQKKWLGHNQDQQPKIKKFISKFSNQNYQNIQTQMFQIPKKIWMYFTTQYNYLDFLDKLYIQNIRIYTKLSGFQLIEINSQKTQKYLSDKNKKRFQELKDLLNKQKDNIYLKNQLANILKRTALLMILQDQGGIGVGQYFAFTENLNWLKDIATNWHCNRGNPGASPQVFGFYSEQFSSGKKKSNRFAKTEVQKYMIEYPNLETFFIASIKGAEYISDFLDLTLKLMKEPQKAKNYIARQIEGIAEISIDNIYESYYSALSIVVLLRKQKQIDQLTGKSKYKRYAIDYYGLNTINRQFFPNKMGIYFENVNAQRVFQHLAHLDAKQFQQLFGPIRYLMFIEPHIGVREHFWSAIIKKNKGIMRGSVAHKLFFMNNHNIIFDNIQKPFIKKQAQSWNSLPKFLWLYWDTGIQNSMLSNQLLVANILRKSQQIGFKATVISDQNAKHYLNDETIKIIQDTLSNAQIQVDPQKKSDLYRLALLSKYGGVYMDASYCLVENLDWLINIAQQPSQFIYNRFGELPKVFLFSNSFQGWPYQWIVRPQYNTKQQWQIGYDSSFIAAQIDNELIKQWFDQTVLYISKPYAETAQRLIDCGVSDHKFTSNMNQYLVVMDAIKCVIGRRQIAIEAEDDSGFADASDYYKIWSVNGFNGPQKIRQQTNYQRPKSTYINPFIYRYSQEFVQSIIGKIFHLSKISKNTGEALNLYIEQNYKMLGSQYHPQSIFARYIYQQNQQLEINEGKIILKN